MEFQSLAERALEIRRRYEAFEKAQYRRMWTDEELMLGFVGDVGDLAKLIQARNGIRNIPDAETKLVHELADYLWSVIVLADACGIDLEQAFLKTMNDLETHLTTG